MEIILKIFKQTTWQLIGKVVNSLISIIVLGIISRTYFEEGTGIYTLALVYLSLFYITADFGFNIHLLPEIIQKISIWQKLLGLRLIFSVILMIFAAVIIFIYPSALFFKQAVLIGLLAIIANGIFITSLALFQIKLRYDLATISQITLALISLALVYLISINHLPIPNLMIGHLTGSIFCAGLSLYFVSKFINFKPIIDLQFIKKTISASWPISLTILLNLAYFRADTFILSSVKGFADVGVYNLAFQIFQSLLVFPSFIMNSLYPIMLKEKANNLNKFYNLLRISLIIMFVIGVLGTIFTLLLSPFVIQLISGGKGFLGSSRSLQILATGFPAFFVSSILMWILIIYKKYFTLLTIYSLGLIINITLNLIYIPLYSFTAAAVITVVSEYLIVLLASMVLLVNFKNYFPKT